MSESRWFHLPRLHLPRPGHERRVSWLELFYDLIYVATIIQLGNLLAGDASLTGFLRFAGLFVPLWLTWTGFTFYSNRYIIDDVAHRGLVFLQMFAVAGMAVVVPNVARGDPTAYFAFYALTRFTLAAMHGRTWRQHAESREFTGRYAAGFSLGAVLWLISAFTPPPWAFFVYAAALGVDLATSLSPNARSLSLRFAPDVHHMSERYGLLVLIVLGESFVKVLDAVGDHGLAGRSALMGVVGLLITFSLWWVYFDDVAGSRLKKGALTPFVWVYTHLPLTLGITAVGVAIKKAVLLDPMAEPSAKVAGLLCGSLALVLLSVGIVDMVTERRQAEMSDRMRVNARLGSALVVLLLTQTGSSMSALGFLGLVGGLCVLQVFFDLSMAPDAPVSPEEHGQQALTSNPAERARVPARRLDASDVIRVGTPDELKRDLYFHLMEGSWWQISVVLGSAYIVINAVFASLYLMEPSSVTNVRPGSFMDAFSFSVQTIATIGYGVMSPSTTWANTLVLIESAVGMIGVALVTGLVFARVSRPRSSVLFSEVAVITVMNGVRTLIFRVANARGNEVVDASIRVVAVMDEFSPEGHVMRRLIDLPLVRNNSPLFMMSWSVMHPIDDKSPLRSPDREEVPDTLRNIIVTMTGHDGTYNQTVYARHSYLKEDMRYRHRFVDVVSTTAEGRLIADFRRFHDVVAEG